MTIETRPYDSATYLDDEETARAYLAEAFAAGDARLAAEALGAVARARGMTRVAREAGVSRESLYRSLGPGGNPELATVVAVMRALGFALDVAPAVHPERSSNPIDPTA